MEISRGSRVRLVPRRAGARARRWPAWLEGSLGATCRGWLRGSAIGGGCPCLAGDLQLLGAARSTAGARHAPLLRHEAMQVPATGWSRAPSRIDCCWVAARSVARSSRDRSATSAIGRPVMSTRSIASRWNSSENFRRGRDCRCSSLCPMGTPCHPGSAAAADRTESPRSDRCYPAAWCNAPAAADTRAVCAVPIRPPPRALLGLDSRDRGQDDPSRS
jgi:hypothetical protein